MNPLQSTWKNLYLVLEMFFGDFVKEKVSGNGSHYIPSSVGVTNKSLI